MIWVDGFNIPAFENDNLASDISAQFEAFKKWAKIQVDNI